MKIILSFDSFKGGMTAQTACDTAASALKAANSSILTVVKPMADGGEGTASAMISAMNGEWIPVRTMGPLPNMDLESGFAWFEDQGLALIEMATSSGLPLLEKNQRNPLRTTTFGTGQLLNAAIKRGARRLWLAVGGSATVDGGIGAAQALGWNLLDGDGNPVGYGGGELEKIVAIAPPKGFDPPPAEVLCDVDNPLCGERGAARIFAPQKGATPEMVETLEAGLAHLGEVVRDQLGKEIVKVAGAGAAGGLAAGAIAFLNARLVSGIEAVIDATRFKEEMQDADWVITGEGSFDAQSLDGKVVSGILKAAKETGTRVCVIAGRIQLSPEECKDAGIDAALALRPAGMSLEEVLTKETVLLAERIQEFIRERPTPNAER